MPSLILTTGVNVRDWEGDDVNADFFDYGRVNRQIDGQQTSRKVPLKKAHQLCEPLLSQNSPSGR